MGDDLIRLRLRFKASFGGRSLVHIATWDEQAHVPRIGDKVELIGRHAREGPTLDNRMVVTGVLWLDPKRKNETWPADVEVTVRKVRWWE